MGVFDDKKFDELDWISQATEPIDSQLNDILTAIPDSITIDFDTYCLMAREGYGMDLNVRQALDYCITRYSTGSMIPWDQMSALKNLFKFEADDDVIINFENGTVSGNLRLTKLANTIDEKVLANLLGKDGLYSIQSMTIPKEGISRANDIMELLGKCDNGLKSRSERRKQQVIRDRMIELFKANEWMIKDTELANKIGRWVRDYVVNGNLAAYSNFCRLKVMTHKGQPIYSMTETV